MMCPAIEQLSSWAVDFFDTGIQNLLLDVTNASVPVVTTMRSSLCTYVIFLYHFFLFACFVNSSLEVTLRLALLYICGCSYIMTSCYYLYIT
jgi:hypothetical protein